MAERSPWERRPGENAKRFQAFAIYRDLGPARSLAKVAATLGKHPELIERWSREDGWGDRVLAWDDEADRRQRERDEVEREQARRRMREEHAQIGMHLRKLAQAWLGEMLDADGKLRPGKRIGALTVQEVTKLVEVGTRLEQLARGDATGRIDVRRHEAFVQKLVEVALRHLPEERVDAFLAELDEEAGMGAAA